MNLKRKQKKGRRNQSGQRQRHKAVSAGCQFWFKPAPSKARSFASVLARVVPTPALAPLDKKHQRSSGCVLPYHLKQRQLGYWTVPGTTLLGAICFYLATKSWKHPPKKQVTKLTWPLSSAPVPVSHDPTSAEVQSHVKQCPTNLMDCECMYTVKCQCDASHGSMMTDVGHEGLLGSTYSILPFNLISFSLGPSLEIRHGGHCKSLQSESFMIHAGWAVDTPGFGTRIHMAWWCMWTLWTFFFFFFLLLFLLLN